MLRLLGRCLASWLAFTLGLAPGDSFTNAPCPASPPFLQGLGTVAGQDIFGSAVPLAEADVEAFMAGAGAEADQNLGGGKGKALRKARFA